MPEKDNWDELRNRLQNYSEEPDDSWEKISSALSPQQVKSSSAKYWIASVLVGVISLLIPFTLTDYRTVEPPNQLAKLDSLIIDKAKFREPKVVKAIEKQINRQSAIKSANSVVKSSKQIVKTQRSQEKLTELNFDSKNDHLPVNVESTNVLNQNTQPLTEVITSSGQVKNDSLLLASANSKKAIDSAQKAVAPIIIKENKKSRLSYYASMTPVLNYYSITSKEALNGRVNGFDSKGIFSTDRFGIAAEFGIQFPIHKKLELFSGFTYYYQNQKLSYQFIHSDRLDVEKVEESLTYIITPRQSSQAINYQMNNIGLNLGILYEINQRRGLSQQAGLSILYQYGLSKNGSSYENWSSSYWSYQLSYRMTFDLGTKKFFVQPSLLNLIGSKENLNAPISIRTTRAGIGLGVIF
jgi:hypothetical protein